MRRPRPSGRYVVHQYAPPTGAEPDGRWCLVDSDGPSRLGGETPQDRAPVGGHRPDAMRDGQRDDAEREAAMLASADERQAFTDTRDPDGHHLFVAVTLAELREMGLSYLVESG